MIQSAVSLIEPPPPFLSQALMSEFEPMIKKLATSDLHQQNFVYGDGLGCGFRDRDPI